VMYDNSSPEVQPHAWVIRGRISNPNYVDRLSQRLCCIV
jgi:hypothetical protein